MSVIIEFSVPAKAFEFGSALHLDEGTEVRVEQLVPMGDSVMPFSWVSGNLRRFERELDREDISYSVIIEDEDTGRQLYRLEWDASDSPLIQAILDSDGVVTSAAGTHEEWTFSVRFNEREDLSMFHNRCSEADIEIATRQIYKPITGDDEGLTPTQTHTLLDAYEKGYFEIPRETSLIHLAEKYGVSDQAVSERLRRAISGLIETNLSEEEAQLGEVEVGTKRR